MWVRQGSQQGFTCLNDPVYGGGPYTGCNVPLQFFEYHTNPERWSNELRLASKPGGRFHWLAGVYSEKTRDKNSGSTYYMPGLRTDGAAFQYYEALYGTTASSLPPGIVVRVPDAFRLPADHRIREHQLRHHRQAERRSGHRALPRRLEVTTVHTVSSPMRRLRRRCRPNSSQKWNSKFGINYKLTDKILLYADFAQGFRDGGANSGYPQSCYDDGVPHKYVPDTLNNYELGWKTTSLNGRLLFNGAAYLMRWKDLQTSIYDFDICPPSSFNVNVGDARVHGAESNVELKLNENWSMQAAASYTDSHLTSSSYPTFQENVGERLPFVPYFSYSWNVRYEHPLSRALSGYVQVDSAYKGDMWNDLHVAGSHGFPRIDQPAYTITNLRLGLNPEGGHWLAELYVRNLTDKNAIIYSNTGNFDLRETTNEPRVIGLRLNYRFGKETNAD